MKRFVIVSLERSGSHYLRGALNSHPEARVYGDIFHRNPANRGRTLATLDIIRPWEQDEPPAEYLENVVYRPESDGLKAIGFKFVHLLGRMKNPVESDLYTYISNAGIAVLHLERKNLLNRYLSRELARRNKAWINVRWSGKDDASDSTLRGEYREGVFIDPSEAADDIRRARKASRETRERFSRNPCFAVAYESLLGNAEDTFREIQEFLDLSPATLVPDTVRQRSGGQRLWISNYEELQSAFMGRQEEEYLEP
jgi:hypothetical protein